MNESSPHPPQLPDLVLLVEVVTAGNPALWILSHPCHCSEAMRAGLRITLLVSLSSRSACSLGRKQTASGEAGSTLGPTHRAQFPHLQNGRQANSSNLVCREEGGCLRSRERVSPNYHGV